MCSVNKTSEFVIYLRTFVEIMRKCMKREYTKISKIRFVIEEEYFDAKFVADESRGSLRKFRGDQRTSNVPRYL